jgi:hypothetical protein
MASRNLIYSKQKKNDATMMTFSSSIMVCVDTFSGPSDTIYAGMWMELCSKPIHRIRSIRRHASLPANSSQVMLRIALSMVPVPYKARRDQA